jgi:hypothetical protein
VPIKELSKVLEFIKQEYEELFLDSKILEFHNYYLGNYIGVEKNGVFENPRYRCEFWNCYTRVLMQLPRTINVAEAWHRSLNSLTDLAHPNLGKFINNIQKEEEKLELNSCNGIKKILN